MTCHPWERKPNWASVVWPKLSHQYQSLSNCGSWGNMWEEGKHLPCHYSRLSQFTPTPNLLPPLPSHHPINPCMLHDSKWKGRVCLMVGSANSDTCSASERRFILLPTLYGSWERSRGPLTWARAGTQSQPGPSWQIGNELLCVVRLRFGHCNPPTPQRPNVVGDNKRVEILSVVVIHGSHPSVLSFSPWAQWAQGFPRVSNNTARLSQWSSGGEAPFSGYKHCGAHQVNKKFK